MKKNIVKMVVTCYKGDDSSIYKKLSNDGRVETYTFEMEDWTIIKLWKGKDKYTLQLKDMHLYVNGKSTNPRSSAHIL